MQQTPAPLAPNCSNLTSRKVSTMDSRLILLVSSSSHLKDKMCKVLMRKVVFPLRISVLIAVGGWQLLEMQSRWSPSNQNSESGREEKLSPLSLGSVFLLLSHTAQSGNHRALGTSKIPFQPLPLQGHLPLYQAVPACPWTLTGIQGQPQLL